MKKTLIRRTAGHQGDQAGAWAYYQESLTISGQTEDVEMIASALAEG